MTSLVLAMLRARRGQALTLALLAMFAVAAAVAAPAYLRAVDAALVAGQVASASTAERGIVITSTVDARDGSSAPDYTEIGGAVIAVPGFTQIYASDYATIGIEPDPQHSSRLTYRQDECAHLLMVSGRCLTGEGEVVVGEQSARRLNLRAGDAIELTFATFSTDPRTPVFLPDGVPRPLTVVGTYRVPAPDDPYWGTNGYFAVAPDGSVGEPVFTNAATMTAMDHGATRVSIDATAAPRTFDADHLDTLRAQVSDVNARATHLDQSAAVNTSIPRLLDRIDQSRALARQLVPVAAVPLVMLACFVIFLAVGYGTEGRRPELAVVALRGARAGSRWWLATGESVLAIVAGALAGSLVGQLLVGALAAWRFPGVDVAVFSLASLRYAPVAAAGAILAAILAQRRQLVSPVVELLRRVPAPGARWRGVAAELVVVLLAVVTAAQLWLSGGRLVGVGLLAPALCMLALSLGAARALLPLASRYAGAALRRGHLSAALAGFQLARRPGAQRLFLVLVAALAVLGFGVCVVDVAARDRDVDARIGTGADRVLSVAPVTRDQLLHAVRAADPQGRYAMAVTELPRGAPGEAPRLAVDATRLAAVTGARGDFGGPSATEVARLLRPPAPPPLVVPGQDVTLDLTVTGVNLYTPTSLDMVLSSVSGRGTATVHFGVLHSGPYTYQQRVPVCVDGCRLAGVHVVTPTDGASNIRLGLTLRGLRTVNPARVAAAPADLADLSRWRFTGNGGSLVGGPDGLRVDINAPEGLPGGAWVRPVDGPERLPVVSTDALPRAATLAGLDGRPTPVAQVARARVLPRLGADGTLVDLEYAERASTDAGSAERPEVWLAGSAPADMASRLAAHGLVVTDDVRADAVRRRLDEQGPALASWFYLLAGALAVVLAAGGLVLAAAVDRRRRVEDLTALRVQGLDRRTVARATLWTYPVLVLAAGLVGLVAALVGWRLTGWALPLMGGADPALPFPTWPGPVAVLLPWLGAVVGLAATALAVGHDLRRAVGQDDG